MKKVILCWSLPPPPSPLTAAADITGAVTVELHPSLAEDFRWRLWSPSTCQDLYLTSNDAADTVLNVYNMSMAETLAR